METVGAAFTYHLAMCLEVSLYENIPRLRLRRGPWELNRLAIDDQPTREQFQQAWRR